MVKKGLVIRIRVKGTQTSYRVEVGDELTYGELALAYLQVEKIRNLLLEMEKEFKPVGENIEGGSS